jgi:hypothetical protein
MSKAILLLLIPFAALGQTRKNIQANFAFGPTFTSQLIMQLNTGLSMLTGLEYHFSGERMVWGMATSKMFTYTKSHLYFEKNNFHYTA